MFGDGPAVVKVVMCFFDIFVVVQHVQGVLNNGKSILRTHILHRIVRAALSHDGETRRIRATSSHEVTHDAISRPISRGKLSIVWARKDRTRRKQF